MKLLFWALVIVAALYAIDRLLLAAEARGWIYWRKKSASPGTTASAMLEVQSLIQPGNAHVVEALRSEASEEDDEGDDISSRDKE